jgi:hypothetical protein
MKNILLTLMVFGSFGVFSHEAHDVESYICDCDSFINNKDYLVKDCPGNPKVSNGLLINLNENSISFQDKKYFFKDNPNTLSGRLLDMKKGFDGETLWDHEYKIEFEKITKALRLEIIMFEKNLLEYTQIFSCKSP